MKCIYILQCCMGVILKTNKDNNKRTKQNLLTEVAEHIALIAVERSLYIFKNIAIYTKRDDYLDR